MWTYKTWSVSHREGQAVSTNRLIPFSVHEQLTLHSITRLLLSMWLGQSAARIGVFTKITPSSYSQQHRIGNNGNTGISSFTMWKQKKSNNKMLPNEYSIWDLSHSGLMLSSLSYQDVHVPLGISSNCLLPLHHFNLGFIWLEPIEHDHVKILDLPSNTCLSNSERRADQIQMA